MGLRPRVWAAAMCEGWGPPPAGCYLNPDNRLNPELNPDNRPDPVLRAMSFMLPPHTHIHKHAHTTHPARPPSCRPPALK